MQAEFYRNCGKRLFDLLVTIPGVVFFAPLMGVLAVVVRLDLGRPVLFRQQRPGLNGVPLTLLKFRTMKDATNAEEDLLPDEDRLTSVGTVLRSLSLDELPALWNVIRGDMSLVGPRPLLMQYLQRYTPDQARRHEVKPGITGWAQVNGRNALTWESRFEHDVWYVDHQNFGLDIKILFRTFVNVLKRKGINAEGHVTTPEFMGSREEDDTF